MAKTVLIVDDEADVLAVLEKRLIGAGYRVIKADNGLDAVKLARLENPNLILLDVMMPDLDGAKTAQLLRDDPGTRNIPVMFLTCLITPKEEHHGLKEAGGHFFIAKPYEPQDLLSEIRKHIA